MPFEDGHNAETLAMIAYWDTSALLKLVYQEPRSADAGEAQQLCTQVVSWDWAIVEGEAAVARRGGQDAARVLRILFQPFVWVRLNHTHHDAIIALCRKHRLRSADGGHLFAALKAREIHAQITLVCFDEALRQAAEKENLPVFG